MDDRGSGGLTQSPLHRLASQAGLDRRYVDALGTQREVSDDGLRALLAALGFPAATDQELEGSLKRCEEARWCRPLEPVQVLLRTALPARVPITLPEATERLCWRLEEESGAAHPDVRRHCREALANLCRFEYQCRHRRSPFQIRQEARAKRAAWRVSQLRRQPYQRRQLGIRQRSRRITPREQGVDRSVQPIDERLVSHRGPPRACASSPEPATAAA